MRQRVSQRRGSNASALAGAASSRRSREQSRAEVGKAARNLGIAARRAAAERARSPRATPRSGPESGTLFTTQRGAER